MANFNRRHRDYGLSTLEFALMAPFLLLLLVGLIEIGRVIFYTVEVNNAATAGVQFGAQNQITAADAIATTNTAVCDANGGIPPNCNTGVLNSSNVTVNEGCTCD